MSVVKVMKAAGLPINLETAYRRLEEIVNERGPDETRHFNTLLERCLPVGLQGTWPKSLQRTVKFMISALDETPSQGEPPDRS